MLSRKTSAKRSLLPPCCVRSAFNHKIFSIGGIDARRFFSIALWNLLKYEQNFVHRLVHTAPFAKNLSKLGAIRPEMKNINYTAHHLMSRREPVTTAALKYERFFALLQWPKNRVGLQAPLSSTNRRAGAKRVPAGGRKSPSGPEIAFPGCVHAHSGSFGGGHLKYYINWRTKFQRFGWWNFRARKFFCVWVKKISHQH